MSAKLYSVGNWLIVKALSAESLLEAKNIVKGFSGNTRLRKTFFKTTIECDHNSNDLYKANNEVYLKPEFFDSIYKDTVFMEGKEVWIVPLEYVVAVVDLSNLNNK